MKDTRQIVQAVQVTEKGTRLTTQHNQYLLKVAPSANKLEIKRAVETLFNVGVTKVNTMQYQGKAKRSRTMRYGRTPAWKRAVVTLKTGDKIDLG